ncbi:MAG: hypothetical protein WBF49_00405 [Methyloceanibacter sp.]
MMKAYLVVAGVLILVVSPAVSKEFYLAQELATKKCKIMQIKPDGTTMIMIGTYATGDEAKAARSKTTAEECPHKPKTQ